MKRDCVLEGIIGEYGPSAYLALHGIKHEWNPKRVPGGDGDTDIVCYGQRIQIKSGFRWIRRVDSLNRILPLNFDICLFATVDPGFAYVDLDGWMFRDALLKMRLGKRRPQGHINIECSPIDFDPMPSLVSRLVETPEHQAFLDS